MESISLKARCCHFIFVNKVIRKLLIWARVFCLLVQLVLLTYIFDIVLFTYMGDIIRKSSIKFPGAFAIEIFLRLYFSVSAFSI